MIWNIIISFPFYTYFCTFQIDINGFFTKLKRRGNSQFMSEHWSNFGSLICFSFDCQTLSRFQQSENVRICQSLPRQPVSKQGASISPHSILNFSSSKPGKHNPCTWLHKREFSCQQTTPSVGSNYLRRSKTNLAVHCSFEILRSRCQGTVL